MKKLHLAILAILTAGLCGFDFPIKHDSLDSAQTCVVVVLFTGAVGALFDRYLRSIRTSRQLYRADQTRKARFKEIAAEYFTVALQNHVQNPADPPKRKVGIRWYHQKARQTKEFEGNLTSVSKDFIDTVFTHTYYGYETFVLRLPYRDIETEISCAVAGRDADRRIRELCTCLLAAVVLTGEYETLPSKIKLFQVSPTDSLFAFHLDLNSHRFYKISPDPTEAVNTMCEVLDQYQRH